MTAFAFLGYFVFGKLAHVFYGTANVFLRNLGPTGRLVHADVDALAESDPDALERARHASASTHSRWKALLDLDACMNCGRCEEVCPAHQSGVPLSPRKLIRDLKHHLTLGRAVAARGTRRRSGRRPPPRSRLSTASAAAAAPQPAVLEVELWGCRTCGACQRECPVYIEHVPKIVDMRRALVHDRLAHERGSAAAPQEHRRPHAPLGRVEPRPGGVVRGPRREGPRRWRHAPSGCSGSAAPAP